MSLNLKSLNTKGSKTPKSISILKISPRDCYHSSGLHHYTHLGYAKSLNKE